MSSAESSAEVRGAAARALREGATHYTDVAGIAPLRAAVAAALGGGIDAGQVVITGGGLEGLALARRILAATGEVIVVEATERFDLRVVDEQVRAFARLGIAAIVVGAPPRAAPALLEAGATLVGDLDPEGLEGWRVGYLVAEPELIGAVVELKQGLSICTAAVSQHAALAVLRDAAPGPPPAEVGRTEHRGGAQSAKRPERVGAPVEGLADEGTRQRYQLLDLLARTPGAITLGRGDPDLPTPTHIVDAAIAAIARGADRPTAVEGMQELRTAIAQRLAVHHGVVADPAGEIVVTTGGQEAIFLVLQAILGPGDEILMPDPRYTAYDVAVAVAGAKIVSVPPVSSPAASPVVFGLDADALEAAITPRTRALLLITPGNPTGAVADRASLLAVAELARRHDLLVISDEMYERIRYDGVEHVSIGSLPGMADQTITVGGFSKAYAMTGWRVGYVAGPASIMEQVRRAKARWSGCAPVVSQHAALAALTGPQEPVDAMVAEYARRRAIALPALARMGLPVSPSQGAFYAFVETRGLGLESFELSRRLLVEGGVFLYPGSGFGARWATHMRLAWLQPEPLLTEALERMERWIR